MRPVVRHEALKVNSLGSRNIRLQAEFSFAVLSQNINQAAA